MSSSELQALFSSLRPRSSQGRNSASPAPAQASRETSSPLPTKVQTSTSGLGRPTSSMANDDAATPRQPQNATAQNLLNLLNFKGSPTSTDATNPAIPRPVFASREETSIPASNATSQNWPPTQSSDAGLISHGEQRTTESGSKHQTSLSAKPEVVNEETPTRMASPVPASNMTFSTLTPVTASSQQANPALAPAESKPLFTYTNPFEALNKSRAQTPKIEIADKEVVTDANDALQDVGQSTNADIAMRKKLIPKPRTSRSETVQKEDPPQPVELQNTTPPMPDVEGKKHSELPESLPTNGKSQKHASEDSSKVQPIARPQSNTEHVNGDTGSGEWEDSDEHPAQRVVPVYNFPIKAFMSMTLHLSAKSDVKIREGSVMEISRLKKDFDQLDRSLAAATSKYIGYAFTKHGGLRIIRQDDGSDRHVFKTSHDRIFNVAFCTTSVTGPPTETQAILGTGVSGTVYYAAISEEGKDLFDQNLLDSESLVFPPATQADETTAGGLLKTRAKRSSRSPEYFAIGRGKYIHIIWPRIASEGQYHILGQHRTVDVDKLHDQRPVYIQTGKAGKDFAFSEDDSCIVSLDKTGRLRFWDIRPLVHQSAGQATKANPLVVDKPALSLSTASPTEKSWPTSVLFVDKARPYIKGGALRYVLVGLRQNHTLQLWDIALSKAVQELNFPHASETDGICSICYHPASGIVVVGHPTRNSIFFVHLSAPKYVLSPKLEQSSFVTLVARNDPDIGTPDATACFTGIREISFADKGELRSVELLPIKKASDSSKSANSPKPDNDAGVLFELYVAHSKGVTCLAVNREDMGWDANNKVVSGIDAKKENILKVRDLKLGSVIEEPVRSKSPPQETIQPSKSSKKKAKKAAQAAEEAAKSIEADLQDANEVVVTTDHMAISATEHTVQELAKELKKSKKKATTNDNQLRPDPEARSVSPAKKMPALPRPGAEVAAQSPMIASPSVQLPTDFLKKEIKELEQTVSAGVRKELAVLQENISADRLALDQASLTRQEAIIRLVSSSLSTNVEKSLSRIVMQKIESDVLPALLQTTSTQMSDILSRQLEQIVSREMSAGLSTSVSRSMESGFNGPISDAISRKLSSHIEKQLAEVIVRSVTPLCQSIAQQTAAATQTQFVGQLQKLQTDHATDRLKLDKLNQALQGMATTLQIMSDSQIAFQEQILRERQELEQLFSQRMATGRASPTTTVLAQPIPVKPKSQAEIELDDVSAMMESGHYEEGTIKWLQSSQPVQLFDEIFARFTPDYLATEVSPLVAFSVAVTVANALDNNIERRIEWISAALDAVDASDPEMTDLSQHAPALISAIVQKLESLYMALAERQHDDPILKPIPALVKKARGIGSLFSAR